MSPRLDTRGLTGRFCGYPGPIPVEQRAGESELHDTSRVFEMTYLTGDYAEFQPRFHETYQRAHSAFREAVAEHRPFAVTQNEVLDAQVLVEAAHLSALDEGRPYGLSRSDDVAEYRRLCAENGLLG